MEDSGTTGDTVAGAPSMATARGMWVDLGCSDLMGKIEGRREIEGLKRVLKGGVFVGVRREKVVD